MNVDEEDNDDFSNEFITEKRRYLIEKASKYPNLQKFIHNIKKTPDHQFFQQFGLFLDDPKQLDNNLKFLSLMCPPQTDTNFDEQETQFTQTNNPLDIAKQTNDNWFKQYKTPIQIHNKIRKSLSDYYYISNTTKLLFETLETTVRNNYKLELEYAIIHEIKSFALNHEINLIHINIHSLTDIMLKQMHDNPKWCIDNILDKYIIDLNDKNNFLNILLKNKSYSNNNDMNYGNYYWRNSNKKLVNNQFNVGDIFVLTSDTIYSGFSECYYIMDYGNKLRQIGIQMFGSYSDNAHIIIPIHITRSLYDPICAYSTFIHQHTSNENGIIEIELQIDNNCHIFNPNYQTFKSIKQQKELIKEYGWIQMHHKGRKDMVKDGIINEYNPKTYSTVYIITNIGYNGCLIGYCNNLHVNKINLSAINKGKYIIKYSEKVLHKMYTNKSFILLLNGYIGINNIPKLIIQCIKDFTQQKKLWEADEGLKISNGKEIKYIKKKNSKCFSDHDDSDNYEFDLDDYSNKLPWAYGVSIQKFKTGIVTFDVDMQTIDGSVRIGIIDVKRIYKLNGYYQQLWKYCQFMYRTGFGIFHANGEKEKLKLKSQIKSGYESHSFNIVSLELDFNKCQLLWIQKEKLDEESEMEKQDVIIVQKRQFTIDLKRDTEYKFFIAMSYPNDCVYASYY